MPTDRLGKEGEEAVDNHPIMAEADNEWVGDFPIINDGVSTHFRTEPPLPRAARRA